MSYTHQGRILENGMTDPVVVPAGSPELQVRPADDGLHITDFTRGDFEWWYFDLADRASDIFLKVVLHIGTDPLRRKIFPQLALSVNTPVSTESITRPYALDQLQASADRCEIQLGNEVSVTSEGGTIPVYRIKADVPGFQCDLTFTGTLEGWKPLGNEIPFRIGKKKGAFSWVVPLPGAKSSGTFISKGQLFTIENATAYHDHNYIRVDKRFPLYLDELVTRWYWGKCTAGSLTLVFMDTWCRTGRIQSLMAARDNRIIYSANNQLACSITATEKDSLLQTEFPAHIHLESTDPEFRLKAELEMIRLLDRKDLVGDLNPLARFLIKTLVARPAYHGVLTRVRIRLGESELEGMGNFESMVFRS